MKADLLKRGIHFSNTPVPGTIKRGELLPFLIAKDSAAGDSSNYHASRAVKNPLTSMDTVEAERLYLVNCAICHGPKLDGNGPLYKGGDGPFPAAPANFSLPQYVGMPEGQMFYSATYGKEQDGELCFPAEYGTALDGDRLYQIETGAGDGQAGGCTPTGDRCLPTGRRGFGFNGCKKIKDYKKTQIHSECHPYLTLRNIFKRPSGTSSGPSG